MFSTSSILDREFFIPNLLPVVPADLRKTWETGKTEGSLTCNRIWVLDFVPPNTMGKLIFRYVLSLLLIFSLGF